MSLLRTCCLLGCAMFLGAGCQGSHFLGGSPTPPDVGEGPGFPVDLAVPDGGEPNYGPTVSLDSTPPPISGGTLLVLAGGATAVAADPDRDLVHFVDLDQMKLLASVPAGAGAEPGRVAEDGAGRVHVVLRGAGAVLDIDATTRVALSTRAVCSTPRGIAYDAGHDVLWVACLGGELVALPAAGGAPSTTYQLDSDLRDVVVTRDGLYVSRFRSADVLLVEAATGAITDRFGLGTFATGGAEQFNPAVAWRMISSGNQGVLVSHQRALASPVSPAPGGYGNSGGGPGADPACTGASIIHSTVSMLPTTGVAAPLPGLPLPVDIALSPDGREVTVAAAGNATSGRPTLSTFRIVDLVSPCAPTALGFTRYDGQPTALAYRANGDLVIQSRQPSTLQIAHGSIVGAPLSLSPVDRRDTGHDVFHLAAASSLACASCHPEGGEDGRVWVFSDVGQRRTQSMRGGVMQRAPFHWDGALPDLPSLIDNVFVGRMSGTRLAQDQQDALSHFLSSIPAAQPPSGDDASAIARGQLVFNDPQGANCNSCHSGPQLTNHTVVDVGTGGAFKVPSLRGVAFRDPFLHDGRAVTLGARFTVGGGDSHGRTSQLSPDQLDDLTAYLRSL